MSLLVLGCQTCGKSTNCSFTEKKGDLKQCSDKCREKCRVTIETMIFSGFCQECRQLYKVERR